MSYLIGALHLLDINGICEEKGVRIPQVLVLVHVRELAVGVSKVGKMLEVMCLCGRVRLLRAFKTSTKGNHHPKWPPSLVLLLSSA